MTWSQGGCLGLQVRKSDPPIDFVEAQFLLCKGRVEGGGSDLARLFTC